MPPEDGAVAAIRHAPGLIFRGLIFTLTNDIDSKPKLAYNLGLCTLDSLSL